MDPSALKRILSETGEKRRKRSRWSSKEDQQEEEEEDDEEAGSDGEDVSIPEGTARLMRRCFNPVTGVGK